METMQANQIEDSHPLNEKDNSLEAIRAILREISESQKKYDRQLEESRKDFDRWTKEYNKRFGDLNNRFGEVVEYMVAPKLHKKFRKLGLDFTEYTPNKNIIDQKNDIHFEVDIMLENGDMAMLVEVKNKLKTEDVKEHIERLEKMRVYADIRGDKRTFLGTVAGVVMTPNVRNYALKQGFFVIEPSGETFSITPPANKPKEW
jgi:predicted AAA+ superfamily ATPase